MSPNHEVPDSLPLEDEINYLYDELRANKINTALLTVGFLLLIGADYLFRRSFQMQINQLTWARANERD